MTGQDLLDRMELVHQELQLQPAEPDVARGLLALNVAQDYFESLVAVRPNVMGSGVGTVAATANSEFTAFPTGVLRIDRLALLGADSLPKTELLPIKRAGGHRFASQWPLNIIVGTAGELTGYWTNGSNIYWSPKPATTSTVRWMGFQVAANITASSTFVYPDIAAFPIAGFAARLLKVGVDDPAQDLSSLAQETFKSTIDALANFNRDGAVGYEYTQVHTE